MDQTTPRLHSFPGQDATRWISEYREEILASKDAATIAAYTRILSMLQGKKSACPKISFCPETADGSRERPVKYRSSPHGLRYNIINVIHVLLLFINDSKQQRDLIVKIHYLPYISL